MRLNTYFGKYKSLFLIRNIFITILFSTVGLGCSCEPTTPEMERDAATVVFAGKVLAVEKIGMPRPFFTNQFPFIELWGPHKTKNTFEVSRIWKGPLQEKFDITSCVGMMCCLSEFKPGDEFLIYAYGDIKDLGIGMCTRIRGLQNITEDLEVLGEGTQIKLKISSSENRKSFWSVFEGITSFFLQIITV